MPADWFAALFAVLMLPVCFIMMPAKGAGAATEAPAEVDQEPWRKDPRVFTRTNTPASRQARSDIWAPS